MNRFFTLFLLFTVFSAICAEKVLKLDFPQRAQLALDETIPNDATELKLVFKAPENLPKSTYLSVYAKDTDALWRQIRVPFPKSNEITVPLAGRLAAESWKCLGHNRPWNCLTKIKEYGIIVEPDTGDNNKYASELTIKEVSFTTNKSINTTGDVLSNRYTRNILVGEIWESTFSLDCWPSAPFNSEKTRITAKITTPHGKTETASGFYYEPFLYDEEQWDKTQCLTPDGSPSFKLRYTPAIPGKYSVAITAQIDGATYNLKPISFTATANQNYHGVVDVDSDHWLYFKYRDGTPFTGIGMNIRSPYDNRYREVAQYSPWQDQGLSMYPRLFRKYKECGINVVEVWMCSWWLALEWIPDAPGFHGVGHYNQYRAWMLDYIMQQARENDLHVILVINNHGKFAMHYDTEWKRNPYNKINGGYLDKCEEYYVNERARQDTKKLLDYIVARWGQDTTLLAWKLFTELDLTGPDIEFYRRTDTIAKWHAEMGAYIKSIDPLKHPVTTHWMLGYHRIDERTANVKELDFLTTDVYYGLGEGTRGMMNLLNGTRDFALRHKKPLIITEYGGSSYADHATNLVKQVPSGIWYGYFNEMGIIPMYWWFALVEDKNMYSCYAALSKYVAGEDRRNMSLSVSDVNNTQLQMRAMLGTDKTLAWLFDKQFFWSNVENALADRYEKTTVNIPVKFSGACRAEIWSPQKGTVIATENTQAKDGFATITLPSFKEHIAIKIKK